MKLKLIKYPVIKLCAAVSFSFITAATFSGCPTWFEKKIPMNREITYASLSDLLTEEKKLESLETPEQLFATQGLYPGKISLRWKEVENATSYCIERAVVLPDQNGDYPIPDEADFELLEQFVYGTSYTDKILSNPGPSNPEYSYHYFYRILAQNYSLGIESEKFTDPANKNTSGCGWLFPSPSTVKASKGLSETSISLTWNSVSNATGYKIYRGEKSNGSGMELIDTTSSGRNFFNNEILESEQGIEFYYKVCAVNSSGYESACSSLAMGYSLKSGAPAAPASVTVTDVPGSSLKEISVSWSPVTISASQGARTANYALYRTSSKDDVFTLIKSGLTSTTYKDSSSLEYGVYYYYYVQTLAILDSDPSDIIQSPFSLSGPESESPAVGFLLSSPENISVLRGSGENSLILRWSPSVGYNFKEISKTQNNVPFTYNIYYADSPDDDFVLYLSGISVTPDSDGFLLKEIENKNFYKISATNSQGTESLLSSIIAPIPSCPENVYATKTELLEKDFFPNEYNVYPVKITWDPPKDFVPSGYNIYRSTKPASGFRKINSDLITSTEYVDQFDAAKPGTYYYYRIVSLNSLNQGSDPCESVYGYGALTADQWFREYNATVKSSQKKLIYMHKASNTDKLKTETKYGDISGSIYYDAHMKGLGAEIIMHYENYADFYIGDNPELGVYFNLTGNTNTTAQMDANGSMNSNVVCKGMYPGTAIYDKIGIVSGNAGSGYYIVEARDLNGNIIYTENVSYLVGNETN